MSHVRTHIGGHDPGVTILRIIIIDHELHHPREFRNLSAFRSVNLTGIFILFGTNLSDNYQRNAFDGSSGSVQLYYSFSLKEILNKKYIFSINSKLYIIYSLNNDNLIIGNNFKRSIY